MKKYTVLFRDETLTDDEEPLKFLCEADDVPHAIEQCENAYPTARVSCLIDRKIIDDAKANYIAFGGEWFD